MSDSLNGSISSNRSAINEAVSASPNSMIESKPRDDCNSCNKAMIIGNAALNVDKKCTPKDERVNGEISLEILVDNIGEILLKKVRLNATLPMDTVYKESSYVNPNRDGILKYPTRIENDNGTTKMLSWFLGDLQTGQNKTIKLILTYGGTEEINCSENKVQAMGYAIDRIVSKQI